MVNYNSLKTEQERRFVILHGELNCFIKRLENLNVLYELMQASPDIYFDDKGFPDEKFCELAKKYAGKEVLITHNEYQNPSWNDNFICGDDNWVFIDDMFVDSNF